MSRHSYPCHVRFSDVDIYRHVNNVKYFEYYQEARLAFMSSLGRETVEPALSLVVARIVVDYKRPIVWRGEPYAVETWVTGVRGSSFGLAAEIKDDGQVLSRAEVTMVTFDLDTQKSRPLTDQERARLLAAVE